METVGRFAPTPSGRLHLGNVLCALLSWLSAKKQGGRVLLRIEDLDTARCGGALTEKLLDDLAFLGLHFDGGYEPESYQSRRTAVYEACFEKLRAQGLLYPCYCSRAQLHAATAPHSADGQAVYDGHCRRYLHGEIPPAGKAPAWRLTVPDETVCFTDGLQGDYAENLKTACGDFLVRRGGRRVCLSACRGGGRRAHGRERGGARQGSSVLYPAPAVSLSAAALHPAAVLSYSAAARCARQSAFKARRRTRHGRAAGALFLARAPHRAVGADAGTCRSLYLADGRSAFAAL